MMDAVCKNIYLLEATCFAACGLSLGLLFGIVGGIANRDPKWLAISLAGLAWCLFWWVFVIAMRALWRMSDWFFRLFMCLGALVIPISLLIADVHLKFLVSRLYTGSEAIPYAFLGVSSNDKGKGRH